MATDEQIRSRIEELVSEERRLWQAQAHGESSKEARRRMQELKLTLDQCWDLLRQRRALEEFGLDADAGRVRPSGVVENTSSSCRKERLREVSQNAVNERARIAVIYYSATGNVHALAHALADGAEHAGGEVRIRHVEELASELMISQNQYWGRHRSQVENAPVATLEDLEWADAIAFGTPTRFGNVAAQLKQFIDQAGRLWQEGKLADKVATAFTSSQTAHGGQETTILALNNTLYHWGMLILPLGYTVQEVFAAGGNPYGSSYVAGHTVTGPDEHALAVATYQGQRLARCAAVIGKARRDGSFAVRRPRPDRFPHST